MFNKNLFIFSLTLIFCQPFLAMENDDKGKGKELPTKKRTQPDTIRRQAPNPKKQKTSEQEEVEEQEAQNQNQETETTDEKSLLTLCSENDFEKALELFDELHEAYVRGELTFQDFSQKIFLTDVTGNTILHYAALYQNSKIIKQILDVKLDNNKLCTIKNADGKIAFEIAAEVSDGSVVMRTLLSRVPVAQLKIALPKLYHSIDATNIEELFNQSLKKKLNFPLDEYSKRFPAEFFAYFEKFPLKISGYAINNWLVVERALNHIIENDPKYLIQWVDSPIIHATSELFQKFIESLEPENIQRSNQLYEHDVPIVVIERLSKYKAGFLSLLHMCLRKGFVKVANTIINKCGKEILLQQDSEGKTPLDLCIDNPKYGMCSPQLVECTKTIIEKGGVHSNNPHELFRKFNDDQISQAIQAVGSEFFTSPEMKRWWIDTLVACLKDNCKRVDIVLALMERGSKEIYKMRRSDGCTLLHWVLSRQRDTNEIDALYNQIAQTIIEKGGKDVISIQDPRGLTPLHYAIHFKRDALAKLLIDQSDKDILSIKSRLPKTQMRVPAQDVLVLGNAQVWQVIPQTNPASGYTPLHEAIRSGNDFLVNYLLDAGADSSISDDLGKTPRDYLFEQHKVELFNKAHALDLLNINQYALQDACLNHDYDAVKQIVGYFRQENKSIDEFNEQGMNALYCAVAVGNFDIVKFLIEEGAQLDVKGEDDKTALDLAIENQHHEIVDFLVEHAKKLAIHFLEHENQDRIINIYLEPDQKQRDEIIKFHPNPNLHDSSGKNLLHYLIEHNDIRSIKLLSKYHLDKLDLSFFENDVSPWQLSPETFELIDLMKQLRKNPDLLVFLCQQFRDSRANDSISDRNELKSQLIRLIEAGADINREVYQIHNHAFKSVYFRDVLLTVLNLAVTIFDDLEFIKSLLNHGAHIDFVTPKGNTILHYAAAYNRDQEILKLLINKQPQMLNAKNKYGITPLHCAVLYQRDPKIIKLLLKCGAKVNATAPVNLDDPRDTYINYKMSPLHSVCYINNTEHPIALKIAKSLLQYNSKINDSVAEKSFETPLYIATEKGNCELIDLLLSKGASPIVITSDGVTTIIKKMINQMTNQSHSKFYTFSDDQIIEIIKKHTHLLSMDPTELLQAAIKHERYMLITYLLSLPNIAPLIKEKVLKKEVLSNSNNELMFKTLLSHYPVDWLKLIRKHITSIRHFIFHDGKRIDADPQPDTLQNISSSMISKILFLQNNEDKLDVVMDAFSTIKNNLCERYFDYLKESVLKSFWKEKKQTADVIASPENPLIKEILGAKSFAELDTEFKKLVKGHISQSPIMNRLQKI